MTARNEAVAKKHAERQKGMQYMPPLSPTAIAKAREQWGISGE